MQMCVEKEKKEGKDKEKAVKENIASKTQKKTEK
jgi:hypothetical protein